MKIKTIIASSTAALVLLAAGCAGLFGTNPTGPTGLEKLVYKDVTNYVPQVVLITNTTTVTNVQVVLQTNITGQVIWLTNEVIVPVPHVTDVTNMVVTHILTPNDTVTSTIGTLADYVVPGSKGVVTLGLTALLALWGHLRSYKGGQTNGALGQEVETLLEFVNALPNGSSYYNAIVGFLRAHQEETGVTLQVLQLLRTKINNPAAKVAAQEVIDAINGLPQPSGTTPLPPVALVDKTP